MAYYGNSSGYSYQTYVQTPQIGLAGYGQSVSSEGIDFNNLSLGYNGALSGSNSSPCCQIQPQQYFGGQIDINDPCLLQQVDQIVSSLNECKRPMLRRQVITVPACCPPRVANITRRLPTPPPDIIERITVIKPPRDVVNLCIEKPCQPGPCFQQREVCGKPRKPIIQPRVIPVPPRSSYGQSVSPCCLPSPPLSPPQPCPLSNCPTQVNCFLTQPTCTNSAQQCFSQPQQSLLPPQSFQFTVNAPIATPSQNIPALNAFYGAPYAGYQ